MMLRSATKLCLPAVSFTLRSNVSRRLLVASYTTQSPHSKGPRSPTSLSNTTKSFGNKPQYPLNIINKKYAEDGKLLVLDISERAMEKLNSIAMEENNPDVALRIGVESGGCHGFQYNLELTDINKKTDEDCVFEKNGARVIIDDSSLGILRESKVDYATELIGSMFKVVDSPYMASSCGCGSSFDFDFSKLEQ